METTITGDGIIYLLSTEAAINVHTGAKAKAKIFGSWMRRKFHVQISQGGAEHHSSHRPYQDRRMVFGAITAVNNLHFQYVSILLCSVLLKAEGTRG